MTTPSPLYVLAADHRWQLEDWCDQHGVARTRIPEIKAVVVDAFTRARGRHASVSAHGALLLDELYSGPLIRRVRAANIAVATPVERPKTFPLEWATDPFSLALTGSIVKVLVRHRPEHAVDRVVAERTKLKELAAWCASHHKPLMIEVLVMRQDEAEGAFEATGRPAILVEYIRDAYAADLVPDFWKIEGTVSVDAAVTIDAAVARHPVPRILVLGKGAGFDLVTAWIAVARRLPTAGGFAVGRTVYWTPCAAWMQGTLPREAAVEQVAANYEKLVDAWESPA